MCVNFRLLNPTNQSMYRNFGPPPVPRQTVRPAAKWLVVGLYIPSLFIHQTAQVLKVVVEFLRKGIHKWDSCCSAWCLYKIQTHLKWENKYGTESILLFHSL
jgi:hypothetical protein